MIEMLVVWLWGFGVGWLLKAHHDREKQPSFDGRLGAAIAKAVYEADKTLRFTPDCIVTQRASSKTPDGRVIDLRIDVYNSERAEIA